MDYNKYNTILEFVPKDVTTGLSGHHTTPQACLGTTGLTGQAQPLGPSLWGLTGQAQPLGPSLWI